MKAYFNLKDWHTSAASAAAGFQEWQRKCSAGWERHLGNVDEHRAAALLTETKELARTVSTHDGPQTVSTHDGVVVPLPSEGERSAASSHADREHAISGIMNKERCNVVLTHVNADFDSLAGAVALAKLWSIERPALPTHVVIPRGVNPLVARFLAYHKHLLPVRGFKTIRADDIAAVGVVDTQVKERLGPAAVWLTSAEHVAVVDHHTAATSSIDADELIVEPVGSATTVLVERLRSLVDAGVAGAALSETEATLCALGIRTDTGALAFPATTARDAYALAWLMGQGCSQSAIAEFGQTRLSAEQRGLLATAMADMALTSHEGLKVCSTILDTGRGFVTGMASVCEESLALLGCDVMLMGIISTHKGKATVSVIGRCAAQATRRQVDLNEVLQLWGGGGHPAAAAASIKLSDSVPVSTARDGHVPASATPPEAAVPASEPPPPAPTAHAAGGGAAEAAGGGSAEMTMSADAPLTALREYVKVHGLAVKTAGKGRTKATIFADVQAAIAERAQPTAAPPPPSSPPPPPVAEEVAEAVAEAPTAEGAADEAERTAARLAEEVMAAAVAAVLAQIPEQVRAEEMMTKSIISCAPTEPMAHVLALMHRVQHRTIPVLDADHKLLGFLKYRDGIKAVQDGKGAQQAKAWMRREFVTVPPDTAFTELERLLIEDRATGRAHVVDGDGRLLGLVSRTDLLRQHQLYEGIRRRVV